KAVNGALPQIADFINTIDIGRYSEVSTTTSMSVCATSSHDGTDPLRSLSRLIFGRTWLPLLCYLPAARETVVLPISTSHSQGSMMKRLRSRIGPDRSSTRESAMSRFHLIAMLVAVAIGVAPAQAQDQFPTKPIRIVLPVPEGRPLDVATRAIADELTARWGQQVLVEARPGAGGLIAGQAVATAAPDGYTLVGGPASLFTILPAQKDKLPIDVNKDFAHIGMIVGSAVLFVAASPNLATSQFPKFVALAKSKPGQIGVGTNGAGTLPHFAGLVLEKKGNVPITVVPYNQGGTMAAVSDILGGRVHGTVEGVFGLRGPLQSGDLKLVGQMAPTREPEFPDVPAIVETLPGIT